MMKSFTIFLEEVKNMNSDKEVMLKNYQDKLDYYNDNKNKFSSILSTKPFESWEVEANKIILGNSYLGSKWKMDKMEHQIKQDEDKIRSNEMSDDEVKKIQNDIALNKKELNDLKQSTNRKIQDDLREIQQA